MTEPALEFQRLDLEDQHDVEFLDVSDLAFSEGGRLFLLTRRSEAVVVYEPDGAYVGSWGVDRFVLPHGITIYDELVHVVDQSDHCVKVFRADGEPVRVIGDQGHASDSGCDWDLPTYRERYLSITHGGAPFNNPTHIDFAVDDSFYVSDGYGNARIHHFGADSELIGSWGGPGSGIGEFRLPHHVCVASDDRILVCDRENDRIQVFDAKGRHLTTWSGLQRPAAVAELPAGRGAGLYVVGELAWSCGDLCFTRGEINRDEPAGLAVIDGSGRVVARAVEEQARALTSPHGIAVDRHGVVHVAQLAYRTPDPRPVRSLVTVSVTR